MAGEISDHYHGKPVLMVPILNGAWRVTSRLMSHLGEMPLQLEPVLIRSYVKTKSMTAELDTLKLCHSMVQGRDILIVDDILDSGQTLWMLKQQLEQWEPASIQIAVMLRKEGCQRPEFAIEPDFSGPVIPDEFVVGMGLDYRGFYRNLSYVGVLTERERNYVDQLLESQPASICV
jgi:hypoxanthine phosphoribosyltransferase